MFCRQANVTKSAAALRLLPALVWLCVGFIALGMTRNAHAQTTAPTPAWHINSTITNFDGTTTMLWVKSGTTDANYNYSGDTVSIWTLNAAGHQVAVGPTYGPFTNWTVSELDPTYDGTLLLSWTHDTTDTSTGNTLEQYSLWSLNGTGYRTAVSPTYGPYPGWTFYGASQQPNGTTLVYWTQDGTDDNTGKNYSGDALSVWVMSKTTGVRTIVSPTYGPYAGWRFQGSTPSFYSRDGSSFLNWVNQGTTDASGNYSGDQASIWKIDGNGNRTSLSPTYGRYAGWRAFYITPDHGNGARMVWEKSVPNATSGDSEQISIWTLSVYGEQTAVSPTYGPYPGWYSYILEVKPDNTSRLMWTHPGTYDANNNYSGGEVSIWTLNAAETRTAISPTYGPTPGWDTEYGFTLDGSEKLLWQYRDPSDTTSDASRFYLWDLNSTDQMPVAGPTYGPYY